MTDDDDMNDLLAAYAIDAVSDEERAGIEAMLADRPDLTAEVDAHREAAAALAEVVAEPPPPDLRERVLAQVADLPQEQWVVAIDRDRRAWRRPALVALAAAAVLVAGFAVALTLVRDDTSDPVAQVLDDPDAEVFELDGTIAETLRVVYSPDAGASVLEGVGVEQTEVDMTYQLWLVADGPPEPAALFRPDDAGEVRIRIDGLDPVGAAVAVTAEPAGGSDDPTPPILAQSA